MAQAEPACCGRPGRADPPRRRRRARASAATSRGCSRRSPGVELVVFPELHLFGDETRTGSAGMAPGLRPSRWTAPGSRRSARSPPTSASGWSPAASANAARKASCSTPSWSSPRTGSSPATTARSSPGARSSPTTRGDRFTTVDLPGIGRVGLNICYDAWYPEVSRQLAWMGAEVILNVVKTTTPDRKQELVLAKANAIVNQVFMVSVNCAGPDRPGPEHHRGPGGQHPRRGARRRAAAAHRSNWTWPPSTQVRTRRHGGLNRPWSQFREDEPAVELPVYQGRINPPAATWTTAVLQAVRTMHRDTPPSTRTDAEAALAGPVRAGVPDPDHRPGDLRHHRRNHRRRRARRVPRGARGHAVHRAQLRPDGRRLPRGRLRLHLRPPLHRPPRRVPGGLGRPARLPVPAHGHLADRRLLPERRSSPASPSASGSWASS